MKTDICILLQHQQINIKQENQQNLDRKTKYNQSNDYKIIVKIKPLFCNLIHTVIEDKFTKTILY